MADITVGATVEIPAGRGTVRFCGSTSFAPGKWIGIELFEAVGKNNGTVGGNTYFSCPMNYGVFVRPSQVKQLSEPEPSRPTPQPLAQPSPRPALGHQRTSSTSGRIRVNSLRAPGSPRADSPAKSILTPPTTVPVTLTRPNRLGQASPTKRTPTLGLQPRKSLLGSSLPGSSPASPQTVSPAPRITASPPKPPSPRPLSPVVSPIVPQPPVQKPPDDETQELRAKIRVLEAKRSDDARHVRELEVRLAEAESFVALRPKLQAKLNSQQTELIATRRELADAQQLAQLSETRVLDGLEQLEMAMLDKEVAEERAEMAEAELEEVKERLAIVDVELGVLREGGGPTVAGEDTGKNTLAYVQLEKHNERLKEALIRLRDMSQETDMEQRKRIAEMERDFTGLDDIQVQYESTLGNLANAEVQIEDLKLQLDDALGAEEMLVQLTERNLMLGEKIEEMRITIEDLESLKELSDELEENHVETEKTLLEDIESKETQIRENQRKIETLEEAYVDLEATVGQFRDLVMQLQNELDTLRAQTQTAQNESATAASQTAAMMSLNLKLQSNAFKNQAKTIELEIKKLEAKETGELLAIVQPYLPEVYVESDSDATSCYLFFQRLAYKADLINIVVAQNYGLPDSLSGSPVSDALVGACEMRGRISGLSTLCKRFAAVLKRCDADTFLNIGRLYQEIAPMEKRMDMHIDLLRRDEFRDMECVDDVSRITAQFDHLAETYFDGFDHDLGEREVGYLQAFDHDLDIFLATLGLVKTAVNVAIQDEDAVLDMGGFNIETELFEPLQKLLDQCKNAKMLSKKLAKRLEELISNSTAIKAHLLPQMKALSGFVAELVNFGISLAQQIMPYLNDVRTSKTPFQLATILSFVKQTANSTVAKDPKPGVTAWEAVGNFIAKLIQDAGALLPLVLETESVYKITGTAPWVARIQVIKASIAVNVEAERKVAHLTDEMQGLVRNLKTKEQNIQELMVKIELMERRMESAKKQSETIGDLEGELAKAKRQDKAYENAIEQLQADLDALEQDNAKLKTLAAGHERQTSGVQPVETENVPIEGSIETSYLLEQIEAFRGTVRYLRTENGYLKGQDLLKEIQALPDLSEPISRLPTPELDDTSVSDSESSDSEDRSPPTLLSLSTERKLLYREVIKFSSSPRVVDLSELNAKRAQHGRKLWIPRKSTPAHHVWERKMEADRLSRRVRGLLDRANTMNGL